MDSQDRGGGRRRGAREPARWERRRRKGGRRARRGGGAGGPRGAGGGGVLEPPNALGILAVRLGDVQGSLTVLWCGGTGEAIRRGRTRGRSRRRGAGGLGPSAAPRPQPCRLTTAPSLPRHRGGAPDLVFQRRVRPGGQQLLHGGRVAVASRDHQRRDLVRLRGARRQQHALSTGGGGVAGTGPALTLWALRLASRFTRESTQPSRPL